MAYEVKSFLFKISEKLSTKESNALVRIYELPAKLRDQSAFDVILQLEMQGRYNRLEELAKILKDINRNDLAKEVNSFAKKNKKKHTSTQTKDRNAANANLECVLGVTKLQHEILTDQIGRLWDAANDAEQRRIEELVEELKFTNDNMNKKFHHITSVLQSVIEKQTAEHSLSPTSSISSTSSNGEERSANPLETEIHAKQQKSHSLPRDLPAGMQILAKQPLLPPPVKSRPVQCTETHSSQPAAGGRQKPIMEPTSQVHMTPLTKAQVQQTKLKPTPAPKPAVKPKPRVTASLQPPKDNRQQPVGSVPTPRTAVIHISEGNDDDDYSELTYGTGDSGFAEAGEFLRPELRRHTPVKPQEQLPPGEYADLNTTTKEPERYYKSTRNCPQMEAIRGIMVDQTANNNDSDHNPDPEYMNVRR